MVDIRKWRKKNPDHADAVKICVVCEKNIQGESVYIGNGLMRHKRCKPLSLRWTKATGKTTI
jgi:hypothetical protein